MPPERRSDRRRARRRWILGAMAFASVPLAGCGTATDSPPAPGTSEPATASSDDETPRATVRRYGGAEAAAFADATTADGAVLAVGSRTRPDSGRVGWAVWPTPDGRDDRTRTFRSPAHRREEKTDVDDGMIADRLTAAIPADAGALLVGTVHDRGPDAEHAWAVGVDRTGDVRWQRQYWNEGANSFRDTFADGRRTGDGGFLLAGRTLGGHAGDRTTGEGWLVRTNSAGRRTWGRTYTPRGDPRTDFRDDPAPDAFSAIAPANGGSLLAGTATPPDTDGPRGWLVRVDDGGAVVWQRTVGDGPARLRDIAPVDDGYIAAGSAEGPGDSPSGWVGFVDASGALRWERRVGDSISGVLPTERGTVVVGHREDAGWAAALGPDGSPGGEYVADVAESQFRAVASVADTVVLAGVAADDSGSTDGLLASLPRRALIETS